jgi:hypothetical protein
MPSSQPWWATLGIKAKQAIQTHLEIFVFVCLLIVQCLTYSKLIQAPAFPSLCHVFDASSRVSISNAYHCILEGHQTLNQICTIQITLISDNKRRRNLGGSTTTIHIISIQTKILRSITRGTLD